MKEHHVETAFREHAELRSCKNFEISRKYHPDLCPLQKRTSGQNDLTIDGLYEWCGRKFQFAGLLHTDGLVGTILVRAYTRPAMIENLDAACGLAERFVGFGPMIQELLIPGKKSKAPFFLGLCSRVGDLSFTELNVNMLSDWLDQALVEFEEETVS